MKTSRLVFCFILLCSVLTGFLLFIVSQKVRSIEYNIRTVDKFVSNEQESLRVLQAEWYYLNRPDRLENVIMDTKNQFKMTKVRSMDGTIFYSNPEDQPVHDVSMIPVPQLKPRYVQPLYVTHEKKSAPKAPLNKIIEDQKNDKSFESLLNGLEAAHGE